MYEFMSAALPWIAIGLALAIFIARNAGRKKKQGTREDYGAEGMALGMCLGTAVATSLHTDIGVGLTVGMLLGLVIGSSMDKEQTK